MRKMFLTLALVAAPAIAVAQQPVQQSAQTPAAHDTSKVKPKTPAPAAVSHRHKKPTVTARDTSKVKPATPAPQDTTKKP